MENLQKRLLNYLEKIVIERNPYYASADHLFVREYIRSHFAKFGEVIIHEFEVSGGNTRKLASVGLIAAFSPENKPEWIAKMSLNPEPIS